MMKQSKLLAEEEAKEKPALVPALGVDADKFIRPDDGYYKIRPIQCVGDYVAIAPFPRNEVTGGGIVVPVGERPDTGLIVGLGENPGQLLTLGQHVKFIPKHKAADLTGEFPDYGKAEIAIYKVASVVAVLPPVDARQM